MPATVQVFTSLMDAFLKHGGADAADMVFQIFQEMQEAGVAPSAVTYGCLLLACGKQRKVDTAFELYQRACDEVCSFSPFLIVDWCAKRGNFFSSSSLMPSCVRPEIAICLCIQQHNLPSSNGFRGSLHSAGRKWVENRFNI